ncbi:hypothetical protein A0H81_05798 [Grifola frondosa]|uniref:Uncharacterized protein n=1 Tax=Grifola frondosa TaxID=5627 RepID=A0A1C7MES8_GRIFR|nr:hypothetical protein A0H81_05798 [Grifola frondosa]
MRLEKHTAFVHREDKIFWLHAAGASSRSSQHEAYGAGGEKTRECSATPFYKMSGGRIDIGLTFAGCALGSPLRGNVLGGIPLLRVFRIDDPALSTSAYSLARAATLCWICTLFYLDRMHSIG